MTQPIEYTVSYSFAGFQAISPATPLPAGPVDNEFASIEASLTSIIGALSDVRRADGGVANGAVTYDGLDADLKARLDNTDTRITVPDLNPTVFAAQSEAEAGVSTDKIMSPANVAQAMDSKRAFASQAQAQAGASALVVLSPARGADQINALRPLASEVQAGAGTDNTTAMTPLRVAQALAAQRTSFTATASLTWGEIAAAASLQQSITVTGAVAGDRVCLGLPTDFEAGLVAQAFVVSANTVRVRLTNVTGSPITPHSGAAASYAVTAMRF